MKKEFEEYIDKQPEEDKLILTNIRKLILEEFPDTEEKFSWNMPLFYLKGNVMWMANFKKHIGIYPEPEVIVFFEEKLKPYKTSKGAIQFQKKEEIPYDLIMEIVRYNVLKNLSGK